MAERWLDQTLCFSWIHSHLMGDHFTHTTKELSPGPTQNLKHRKCRKGVLGVLMVLRVDAPPLLTHDDFLRALGELS